MHKRILSYLWPYRWTFLLALSQVFLLSALEILKPWPLKAVIDHVLSAKPVAWEWLQRYSRQELLLLCCIGLILIYLLLAALTTLNNYTTIRIGQRLVNDLRGDLYTHLQRLSLAFYSRREVGDLLYRVTSDTYSIQALAMNGVFPIATATTLLGGMFWVMVRIDWQLTLIALGICPILAVMIAFLNKPIISAATQFREQESGVFSLVQRAMSSMRIIQAFTKEEEEHHKFMLASTGSLNASLRLYTLQNIYSGAINVVMAFGTAVVVWIAAGHVLNGALSIGDIVVFTAYLASLYGPIYTISQTWGVIQNAKVGFKRVAEILDVARDMEDGARVFPEGGATGDISIKGVCFHYQPDQPILKNLSVEVRAGQKVAIVGPTGVGKSTLVGLLARFFDPVAGRVLIDGVDVRDYQLKSLRTQIAMVLQPPIVFPVTIRENIAYGRPAATDEEVFEAARLARIHQVITQLPKGYDTVVGEQGATLSEGERQRITIARAILRNAPILILDEPTSSVDAETEEAIMAGLRRLVEGRTTFIIAHRLSTVREADVILVLRDGEIVEQGSFSELVRARGPFAALYATQFGLKK